jgi:hypothetical protein
MLSSACDEEEAAAGSALPSAAIHHDFHDFQVRLFACEPPVGYTSHSVGTCSSRTVRS